MHPQFVGPHKLWGMFLWTWTKQEQIKLMKRTKIKTYLDYCSFFCWFAPLLVSSLWGQEVVKCSTPVSCLKENNKNELINDILHI